LKTGAIVRADSNEVIFGRVSRTELARERARGLLGAPPPDRGEGLLIVPCNSIHTLFMKFPIDAIFLDRQSRVVKIVNGIRPFRFAFSFRAASVLEVQAGEAERVGLHGGDTLSWVED